MSEATEHRRTRSDIPHRPAPLTIAGGSSAAGSSVGGGSSRQSRTRVQYDASAAAARRRKFVSDPGYSSLQEANIAHTSLSPRSRLAALGASITWGPPRLNGDSSTTCAGGSPRISAPSRRPSNRGTESTVASSRSPGLPVDASLPACGDALVGSYCHSTKLASDATDYGISPCSRKSCVLPPLSVAAGGASEVENAFWSRNPSGSTEDDGTVLSDIELEPLSPCVQRSSLREATARDDLNVNACESECAGGSNLMRLSGATDSLGLEEASLRIPRKRASTPGRSSLRQGDVKTEVVPDSSQQSDMVGKAVESVEAVTSKSDVREQHSRSGSGGAECGELSSLEEQEATALRGISASYELRTGTPEGAQVMDARIRRLRMKLDAVRRFASQ